jgi:hypothetical protein
MLALQKEEVRTQFGKGISLWECFPHQPALASSALRTTRFLSSTTTIMRFAINRLAQRPAEIPEPFKSRLENVDCRCGGRGSDYHWAEVSDRLYGLYDGVPLSERGGGCSRYPTRSRSSRATERDFLDERPG